MTVRVAIDPGTKALGWSVFANGKLEVCGLVRAKSTDGMAKELRKFFGPFPCVDELVVEQPQVYFRRSPVSGTSLVSLALVAGAVAGALCAEEIRFVQPARWKKQTPKEIHHERMLKMLDNFELQHLETGTTGPKSLIHNVYDAVALGLWAEGRK